MKLTDEQALAAHAKGSVAVTAGAGTGKTAMLAERYLHHVLEDKLSPLSIVAVTFTEKAADELRSRIRARLAAMVDDERLIAEIDAAQISTIHSLARRICNDFFDIADPDGGIPADFTILDDIDSPIWLAGQFELAMAEIDPEIIKELGYRWLSDALKELYADPLAARNAFRFGPDDWSRAISEEQQRAINKLICDPEWSDLKAVFLSHSGSENDKLEISRRLLLAAIEDIEAGRDVQAALGLIRTQRAGVGRATAWSDGGKDAVTGALKSLKTLVDAPSKLLAIRTEVADTELFRRSKLLKQAFEQFENALMRSKRREKALDFNDLEAFALAALRHPEGEALTHYGQRWQAFLVDEFQDTNPVQAELLELLTKGKTLTVVGDEKQAIYGFRGADVEVFGQFRERIVSEHGGAEVLLSRSFRTHEPLVEVTNRIFEPVLGDLFQNLKAEHQTEEHLGAPYVSLHQVEEPKGSLKPQRAAIEAGFIAHEIKRLVEGGAQVFERKGPVKGPRPVTYRDFAVLSRTWNPLIGFAEILSASGVPAVLESGGSLLGTREALDAISLLDFLSEPSDGIPLVALLRGPFFAVRDRQLHIAAEKLGKDGTWWSVIASEAEFTREFEQLRVLLEKRKTKSAEEILRIADRITGYSAIAANLPQGARRLADWNGMLEFLRKLESMGKGDIFTASRHIHQLIDAEVEIPRPHIEVGNAVSLMTIHAAKGLEWPIVFVSDLSRQRSSGWSRLTIDRNAGVAFSMEDDQYQKIEPGMFQFLKYRLDVREKEETKRVLYVAVTRARDRVYLTAAGEKGGELEVLRPGLDAAGVPVETLLFVPSESTLHHPISPEPPALPAVARPDEITVGPEIISATGLSLYARCPKQFKYRVIDGHPGYGEGERTAMKIGSITHSALELGISDAAGIKLIYPEASDEQIQEALRCASAFWENAEFLPFRNIEAEAEVVFSTEFEGIRLSGSADMVGGDFVLDFKTDSAPDPEEHKFQLWAYAHAFHKPKAYIAYLRMPKLIEYSADELAEIRAEAFSLIKRVKQADFAPTPSPKTCGSCLYNTICSSSEAA